tara:strand:+ start:18163 stop:19053 length:891 start_codon:yes stop_codon:yes gene_type:complete
MPIYKPKGNFKNEVIDPDRLSDDWVSARNVVENATSWQFLSQEQSGLDYSTLAKSGAGVSVLQKQIHSYIAAGQNNAIDGTFLKGPNKGARGFRPWLIPYLKGFQEVWDGDLNLTWTATSEELVLIGYSSWVYRLSSAHENTGNVIGGDTSTGGGIGLDTFDPDDPPPGSTTHLGGDFFGEEIRIRIKLGLKLDGRIIEGSGPGTNVATNAPEMHYGAGSREKGIVTSSQSIHLLNAGTHTLSQVAAQAPSTERDLYEYYNIDEIKYSKGKENTGVGVVNSRLYVIRFPRGKMLGD